MTEPRKISPLEAFAFARTAVAQDTRLAAALIEGITQGQEDQIDKLRERLTWSDQSLLAATMLLTGRQTPSLKQHLEFCISKHFDATGIDTGASKNWMAKHPLETPANPIEEVRDVQR